jgi:hypothetical protein
MTNLKDVFGFTSSQTGDDITILKNELPFTAKPDNNEEQIFAAIVKRAKRFLTVEKFPKYLDQNITIEDGISDRAYRTENDIEVPYLKTQVIISFYKRDVDRVAGIFPDDY